jgi:hypothetical protein
MNYEDEEFSKPERQMIDSERFIFYCGIALLVLGLLSEL